MKRSVIFSACALLAVALGAPLIGSTHIDLIKAVKGVSPDHEIFFYARMPRVLLALLAGAALSVTGVLFQCMLRDPLAEPYTLGVSSGSSVGTVIAISLGWHLSVLPAILGAGVVLLIVLGMAMEGRRVSSFTLLLTGVTMNSISFAVILFLHSIASFSQSFEISRWLMGQLDAVEYSTLAWLALPIVALCIIVTFRAPDWNLLAVGDDWATSRGAPSSALTVFGYVTGSILVGLITALAGPIGFVGLIVPHALRLKLGADHRVLLPCAFLAGAAFVALCDVVSRIAIAPAEIPIGVVTALCGGPFFLWLLRTRRRSLWL